MKKVLIGLMTIICTTANSQNLSDQDKLSNYMICNVEISKDGKTLSKHLITTYRPIKSKINIGFTAYHYPEVAVGFCVLEEFDKEFNERSLSKSKGKYLDLCYKMTNGVNPNNDGIGEFYLALRPVKDVFKFDYLNLEDPLKIVGTESADKVIGEYNLSADCKNTMLKPFDSIWAKIRKDRLGNYEDTP